MARVREVEFFSTSFLDLLSCGMGAVIVLMIIFVSQLEFSPKDVRGFYMVSVEIVETDSAFLSQQALTLNGDELMRIEARGPGEFALRLSDGQVISTQASQSAKLQTAVPGCGEVRVGVTLSQEVSQYGPSRLRIQTSIVVKDSRGPQRIELSTDRKRLTDRLSAIHSGFLNPTTQDRWVNRDPNPGEPWIQHWYRYGAGGRFGYASPYPQTSISVSTPLMSGRQPAKQSPRTEAAMMHMTGWAARVRISETLDASTVTWGKR